MAKSLLGALALASLPSALAFRNTSPLFLFSTAELNVPATQNDIVFANEAVEQVKNAINSCPTKTYIVVRQDGVSSTDFVDSRAAPRLAHYLSGKDKDVRRSLVVPEVIAPMQISLDEFIQHHCSAEVVQMKDGKWIAPADAAAPRVVLITLSAPLYQKSATLQKADSKLEDAIIEVADSEDYTVIYTTTPPTDAQIKASLENEHGYEMEHPFDEAVQMELKRDLSSHKRATSKEGGLFERYQYFTPPIFMGFVAIAPLFLIIFVGLRALSSLEVSYFAFSKEMGPAAQRK